jgi:ATP/maltotriose-dependent transcriptional regulator MalT
MLALFLLAFVVVSSTPIGDLFFAGGIMAGVWGAAVVVNGRRRLAAALAARTVELEHEREEKARLAVAEERARIARELHDVVAHSLSVMVVQAGAERRELAAERHGGRRRGCRRPRGAPGRRERVHAQGCAPEELVEAIRVVAGNAALPAPAVTRTVIEEFARHSPAPPPGSAPASPALAELTDREREVLLLLTRGRSNAEIAADLVVSEATVKTHVARVRMKLGVRDRVQAVIFAYESGLVRSVS